MARGRRERPTHVLRVPGLRGHQLHGGLPRRAGAHVAARDVPRHSSGGTLYVLISVGTFSALSPAEIDRYGETQFARAAEPTLGHGGFLMMAIAALLATSSSVNANVFAAANIT